MASYDNRFQTMSLGTSGDATITEPMKGRAAKLNIGTKTNNLTDIAGTKPEIKANRYTNRPNFTTNVADIRGTQSKTLHPTNPNKTIGLNLINDDIEGTKPQVYTFKTGRANDPLNPAYKVPSVKIEPAEAPKFMRQTNQLDDISGTASRPLYQYAMRNNHEVNDIEGTQVGWKPRHARHNGPDRDIMAVADINAVGYKTQRVTDPLNPVHFINGMELADDPLSKPKGLPGARDGGWAPTLSLTTQDIEGAVPGWKPKHVNGGIPEEYRRHFRNTNFVGDIDGAQADTLCHGIRTMRVSDPMAPTYASLDGAPLLDSARLPDLPEQVEQPPLQPTMRMASRGQQIVSRGGLSTPQRQATLDDKDALIDQLAAEVQRLKDATYSRGSLRSSRGPSRGASRGGAPSRGGSGYGYGQTPGQADRMVLQSRDGQPRVQTPAERRATAQLQEDISSVRDL